MTNERKLLEQADEVLLTTHEAAALMNHPAAIDALIGYHDACDAGIDAFWDIETDGPRPLYHAHRRKVLYERGRSIMAEDLDIWPDDLRQAFGFPPLPTEGGVRKDSTTPSKVEGTDNRKALGEAAHKARRAACGEWSNIMAGPQAVLPEDFDARCDKAQAAERLLADAIDRLASLPQPAAAAVPSSTQEEPFAWYVDGMFYRHLESMPEALRVRATALTEVTAIPSAPPAAEIAEFTQRQAETGR